MAATTLAFGTLLILLGVVGYVATGAASITALIPALFGLVLLVLGLLARNEAWRKHAMHAAVVVGLLGFLGSAPGLRSLPALFAGEPVARPAAVISQSLMAVLSLLFVVRCVRSFIDARRNRGKA